MRTPWGRRSAGRSTRHSATHGSHCCGVRVGVGCGGGGGGGGGGGVGGDGGVGGVWCELKW